MTQVPAVAEGWSADGTGTEHGQITLGNVLVPLELLVRDSDADGQLDALLTAAFAWFQLLTGSCLGPSAHWSSECCSTRRCPSPSR
ncbi:hypothetical protein [Streptomyces sp. NBC_00582]|uniref:hypothetical protein n=1 Tax=Streptomyces sp. NBC_00582 TaxID=2975783 RepID=UPI002E80BE46|nr:hypothetical protein [Streptomyces sp. NBC_00582]WUB59273.1 hypothetical protein OG852_02010 [Streptomyces sp. NBC_00582]